ncbi:MAG: cellulase family glycosylhydrolase [Polyangiales bacterium]
MSRLRGSLLFAAVLAACSSRHDDAAPAVIADPAAGTWHVRGGFVRDPDGRAVVMRGVNFAGAHKSKPYFGPQDATDATRIRHDFGMNAVRFLVLWAAIEPSKGTYDDAYLDEVAKRIAWMQSEGILVVVDMHQDLYGEGFYGDGAPRWTCDEARYAAFKPKDPWVLSYSDPNMIACYDGFWNDTGSDGLQAHYTEAWRRVAKRLAGFDVVIGFDPMNEPFWGSNKTDFETARLLPLYSRVVAAVRGEAPRWIAFAEPSAAHNLGLGTHIESFPFDNVAFSPHAYDATAETGMGFNPAGHDVFAQNIASFEDEARALNAALWIGEYGGTPNAGITSYMDAAYAGAGMIAASQMYWSYDRSDGGYGLLNADGTEKAELTNVIVRPYPMRVAGDPIRYAFDAASRTFTTTWTNDPSIAKPTEISVPPRIYPSGYRVTCDCTTEKAEGVVRVTKAPPGEITLTLGP